MLVLKDIVYLYRLVHWEEKLAWTRGLAYVFLGYCVAAQFHFIPLLCNLLVISGICMCAYSLNDLYDYKKKNEKNFMGYALGRGMFSERHAHIYCFLPLVLLGGIFFIDSIVSQILLIVFSLITILYSLPKVNLKRWWRWVYSPICAAVGFLEAYFVLGSFHMYIIFLTLFVFLFHLYTEMIHILEECQTGEIASSQIQHRALISLKAIPYIAIAASLLISIRNPIFLVAIPFALIRIYSLKNINTTSNFYAIHRRIFSALYAPYEYIVYAGCGLLGVFG